MPKSTDPKGQTDVKSTHSLGSILTVGEVISLARSSAHLEIHSPLLNLDPDATALITSQYCSAAMGFSIRYRMTWTPNEYIFLFTIKGLTKFMPRSHNLVMVCQIVHPERAEQSKYHLGRVQQSPYTKEIPPIRLSATSTTLNTQRALLILPDSRCR